jgi:hypothetical protein
LKLLTQTAPVFMIGVSVAFVSPLAAAPASARAAKPKLATRAFPLFNGTGHLSVNAPWLSDHELLHVDRRGILRRCNLITHADTPLHGLTRRIRKTTPKGDAIIAASPGGGWAYWINASSRSWAAVMTGARVVSWPGDMGAWTIWLPDGLRLLQIPYSDTASTGQASHVLLFDVRKPGVAATLSTAPYEFTDRLVLGGPSPEMVIARKPDAWVPASSAKVTQTAPNGDIGVSFNMSRTLRRTQELSVWDLRKKRPGKRWSVTLPAKVIGAIASPQGDQIAWALETPSQKRSDNPSTTHAALWISRADGHSLHKICEIDTNADDVYTTNWLHWSPSGKKISFIQNGALWVTDAR